MHVTIKQSIAINILYSFFSSFLLIINPIKVRDNNKPMATGKFLFRQYFPILIIIAIILRDKKVPFITFL